MSHEDTYERAMRDVIVYCSKRVERLEDPREHHGRNAPIKTATLREVAQWALTRIEKP